MNHSSESYISHNLIIADASMKSGDPEFKHNPRGFYVSLVQEALQELSFDTFFLVKSKTFDIEDGCLKFTMPEGLFNPRETYVHNGTDCNPIGRRNVYWKRNYFNKLSKNNGTNDGDPFMPKGGGISVNTFYCGIRNGVIELSPNCKGFKKFTLVANGLLCNVGDTPTIPMFFRQAVTDYVVVEALSTRIANANDDPKKLQAWQIIMNRFEQKLKTPYTGSWETAQYRVKTMDKKSREDMNEYHSRLDAAQY